MPISALLLWDVRDCPIRSSCISFVPLVFTSVRDRDRNRIKSGPLSAATNVVPQDFLKAIEGIILG